MDSSTTSTKRFYNDLAILLLGFLLCFTFTSTEAYDPFDPTGNITIKWDVMSWMPAGYYAVVTIYNFQQYRHIQAPGWTLGWTWAKEEVIWSMRGAQTTEQGDCSLFEGDIPHSCKKDPTVVDLLPGTPYNQQTANCCRGGIISSWVQDPANAVSSFQLTVGKAGASNTTIRMPKSFTLKVPGPGYTCGAAKIVKPSKFLTADGRRVTQALMTWNITCMYSQFLSHKTPTCCVSLSAFYNSTIINCPTCTCGCQNNTTQPGSCVQPGSPYLGNTLSTPEQNRYTPLVQCTSHMCPIRVHWHVMFNYNEYWRVKVTITNFNYRMNYSEWNLVIQHPNFENVAQIFRFNYKSLTPYPNINDTVMLCGVKSFNDVLTTAGPSGNVQSEILFRKDRSTFTLHQGWALPRKIFFNGDECVMPPPDEYPFLPSASSKINISLLHHVFTILASCLLFLV